MPRWWPRRRGWPNSGSGRCPRGCCFSDPTPLGDPRGLFFGATVQAAQPKAQAGLMLDAARQGAQAGMMLSAGLKHAFEAKLIMSSNGYGGYTRSSYCEVNASARTGSGRGSGWAWAGTEDARRVDVAAAAGRAMDLAARGESPVAVEPGRYTVIIEPEALAQLLFMILRADTTSVMSARAAERGGVVFSNPEGGTRIGERMADPRVQFLYDPADPLMPFSPLNPMAMMRRTEWLRDGVLVNLMFDSHYADQHKLPVIPQPMKARLEIKGPTQTLEEMIAGTRRGIWIHRFSDPVLIDSPSLLLGGVTRDGTFLIEKGKVTRPVKNMRFSESPFYILSRLDAFGVPQRASERITCPRIRAHDFEFTALSDAI
ncbi:metallopeptidase TldD-related protein [Paenirhodobacter sp.]|uniref:metallopeptidase TldD-related protein n=1 Tax=Paenirhodobacter sp. TaxID=1965326 RepID=UPI003B3BFE7D